MIHIRLFPFAAFAFSLFAIQPVMASSPLECPIKPSDASQAASIAAMFPSGDAFDRVDELNAAVYALRAKGVNPALLIDSLIAAYCPTVAKQTQLTDAQKATRVARFAARITRTVYALGSADAIILDVAVPPLVADAINAKAKAAGVSAEDWMLGALEAALR